MAKTGLDGNTVQNLLTQAARAEGWVLCIGAGSSLPVFPSWDALVSSLSEGVSSTDGPRLVKQLAQRYSFDSIIQATQNRLQVTDADFENLLTSKLYEKLRLQLSSEEWGVVVKVLRAKAPGECSDLWKQFGVIRGRILEDTSAHQVARALSQTLDDPRAPSAILSFNAEPLLYCLLNHEVVLNRKDRDPVQRLDPITRSVSTHIVGRIPYFYCHGLLSPSNVRVKRAAQSPDKLVFSEAQYLGLANMSFSWQSSVFLDACRSRRVLFLGVSLSDPNMRRWLAWTHHNRVAEIAELGSAKATSTRHLWLERRSHSSEHERWTEALVSHLGVRVVWLNEWSDVGAVMSRLLEK
jgi:SIR2-like domain